MTRSRASQSAAQLGDTLDAATLELARLAYERAFLLGRRGLVRGAVQEPRQGPVVDRQAACALAVDRAPELRCGDALEVRASSCRDGSSATLRQ